MYKCTVFSDICHRNSQDYSVTFIGRRRTENNSDVVMKPLCVGRTWSVTCWRQGEACDHTWLTLLAVTECAVLQFTNKKICC